MNEDEARHAMAWVNEHFYFIRAQASGSAHRGNKADFGIAVRRPDYERSITEFHILKVRRKWLGIRGVVDLSYNKATGVYGTAA